MAVIKAPYHSFISASRAHSALVPLLFVLVLFGALGTASVFEFDLASAPPPSYMASAVFATFVRLLVAYAAALAVAIPLAFLATRSAWFEKILLPIFDVAQSVPILAFFPLVVAVFLQFGFTSAAAVFIIFMNMLWNIVFSAVAGMRAMPGDISAASRVFGMRGWFHFRRVLLPAILPYLVTGSLLAWAEGWNIVIVAEALHAYVPGGTPADDLFGIGSVLANAASVGYSGAFAAGVIALVGAIALLNFGVWQRLLHHAEKYRFD